MRHELLPGCVISQSRSAIGYGTIRGSGTDAIFQVAVDALEPGRRSDWRDGSLPNTRKLLSETVASIHPAGGSAPGALRESRT